MRKILIIIIALILTSVIATSTPIINRINNGSVLLPYSNSSIGVATPHDRIRESQIKVYNDRVVIEIEDARWASFTDTKSMEPVLDAGSNAIQIIPQSSDDIYLGDIISYESDYAEGVYIHRVIEIGFDNEGWYCIAKGDNNPRPDPGRIRFSQIKRVTVAIIY